MINMMTNGSQLAGDLNDAVPASAPAQEAIVVPTQLPLPAPLQRASITLDGVLGTVEVLPEAEQEEFLVCEAAIQKGWRAFADIGLALARIRDKRLYRAEFDSFEEYCQVRWKFGPLKAYRLIAAAQVFASIAALPETPTPEHESQLRPLFGLTPPQVQIAWQWAAAKSFGRPITARLVKSAMKELQLGEPTPATNRPTRPKKSEQRKAVSDAIGELLALASSKASYDLLIERIEALHGQIQSLFAPSRSKRS